MLSENATFLREVHHAQEIRRKLLLNLMLSDMPGISEEEKRRLLHCVVVGRGPTGVEFSGELSDFIIKDVHQRYSHVKDYIHVTLIEANEILSSFDDRLRKYASTQLTKSGVRLVRAVFYDMYWRAERCLEAGAEECKDLGFDTIELNAGSFGVPENTLLRFVRLIKSAGLRAKPQFGVKFNKADIPLGDPAFGTYVPPKSQTSEVVEDVDLLISWLRGAWKLGRHDIGIFCARLVVA